MRVRLDVSIFSSPVKALGYATGVVSVSAKPILRQTFPWPPEWVALHPSYFSPRQSLIASVDDSGEVVEECFVTLDGIVCQSDEDARSCARFLEQTGGLDFIEYG